MDPSWVALPETNIAPENKWLEDVIPFKITWAMKKQILVVYGIEGMNSCPINIVIIS